MGYAQKLIGQCDPITPSYTIDLSNNADSVWVSPYFKRDGHCCTATGSDNCAEFVVTLNPYTTGIKFSISDGAVPPGALFYEIGCNDPTPVGDTICLSGVGPHRITFCKPGNNTNEYTLTAIGRPDLSDPIYVTDACTDTLGTSGFVESTIRWRAIANPAYDAYLSCTSGCDTTIVTYDSGAPDSVLYELSGLLEGACSIDTIRDTVNVKFISDKSLSILPENPQICFGESTVQIYPSITGGAPPFSYQWSNGSTNDSIDVGVGTYSLIVTDVDDCPAVYDTITVTAQGAPITVEAGDNQTICSNSPSFILDGTVTQATGGLWSGGAGIYSPKADTTDVTYTPTPAEISSGLVTLYLTSTGNGGCSEVVDSVKLTILPATIANFNADSVCFGNATVFNNTSTYDAGGSPSFAWKFGNGATNSLENPIYTYGSFNDYDVELIVTSNGVCSDTISKVVKVLPNINAGFTTGDLCLEDSARFFDTSSSESGSIINWTWSFGDANTSNVSNPTHEYGAGGNYTVELIVENSFGCKDTTNQNLTFGFLPSANFSFTEICEGESKSFTDLSTVPKGTISNWNWDFGDGNSSIVQNPNHSYTSDGEFTIELIVEDAFGCKDTIIKEDTVWSIPVVDFIAAPLCFQDSVFLNDGSSVVFGSITSWEWDLGDGKTSTEQNTGNMYSPGNYTVELNIITNKGCADSVSKNMDIYPSPVTRFSTTNICLGNANNFLDASSISSGTITNWNWDFGDENTSTIQNPNHIYSVDSTYTVELITTSNNGCKDTLSRTVTVNSNPVPDFIGASQCVLDSVKIVDSSTIKNGSITSYSWDLGDGSFSNDTCPTHLYVPGDYTVKLVLSSDSGCTDSVSKSVSIFPGPEAGFETSEVCLGGTNNFIDTSKINTGIITYWTWDFGDGTTSSLQNPNRTFANDSLFEVKLVVESDNGCKDSITQNIEVHSLPLVSFAVTPECFIDSIELNGNVTIKNGSISNYAWDLGDGNTSNQDSLKHLYSPGVYNIKLVATSVFGCSDSLTNAFTLNPNPIAHFNTSEVCDGDNTIFNDSSYVTGDIITDFLWDFGDGNTSIIENPNHLFAKDSIYNVQLVVKTANNCSDTTVQPITVWSNPTVNFSGSPQCFIDSVTFTDSSNSTFGELSSWTWDFDDGTSSGEQNPKHLFTPGTYDVKLIVQNDFGCIDSLTKSLDIYPSPVADFDFTEVCQGVSMNFTDSSNISGDVISQWLWDFGDGTLSSLQNPSHTYLNDSIFRVQLVVTSANNCKDSIIDSIEVFSNPIANFEADPQCFIDSVQFNDLTTLQNGSIAIWEWNLGDGTNSNDQYPKKLYTPGKYNINLKVESNNGCRDSIVKSLDIYPAPVANFGFNQVCFGDSTQLIDSSVVSSDVITAWDWNLGNGETSSAKNLNFIYAIDSVYLVSLTVTTANNCKDTITKYVPVWSVPTPNFNAAPQCFVDSVDFVDLSSADFGIIDSWNWDFGTGEFSTKQNLKKMFAPGTYNVKLVVETDKGCSDSIVQDLDVFYGPKVDFNVSDVCLGTEMNFIDNTSISSGTLTNWNWNFGDGNSSIDQNANNLYSNDSIFDVTLKVTSDNGCSDSLTKSVTVWSVPEANYSALPTCYLDSVRFTNSSTSKLGNINFVQWHFGDGSGSVLTNPAHKYNPGEYDVELIVSNDGGCSDTLEKNLNIYPSPEADFDAKEVCLDSATSFTDASLITDDVITSFVWDFGDGNASSLPNPTNTFITDSVFPVKLIVTTANGCSDSITKNITTWSKPELAFNASPVCFLDSVRFLNASAINLGVVDSWSWDLGDGNFSNEASPVHFYTPGNYSIKLTASTNRGCTDSIIKSVDIYPAPVADFNAVESCEDSPVVFTDNSSITGDFISNWTWDFGDGSNSILQNPINTFSSDTVFNVELIVETSNGCKDSITKTITSWSVPLIDFAAAPQCFIDSVTFIDNSLASYGSINSWNWDLGDGTSSTDQNPTKLYTPGNYTIKLIATTDQSCVDSLIKSVDIYPAPVVDFITEEVCEDSTNAFLNLTTISSGSIIDYSWDFGDGNISSGINPNNSYLKDSTYVVKLIATSNNNCVDSVEREINVWGKPIISVSSIEACYNDSINFKSLTLSTNDSIVNQVWKLGDETTKSGGEINHLYATDGTYNVTLIVTTLNGCVDSNTYEINAQPKPIANFLAPSVCFGDSVEFYNTSSVPSGALSYEWKFGDGSVSNIENAKHNYTAGGDFSVELKVTSINGCVDSIEKDLSFFPNPVANFGSESGCIGGLLAFNDSSSVKSGIISNWLYDFDNGFQSTNQNPVHSFIMDGIYEVSLIIETDKGCRDTTNKSISIYKGPEANFNVLAECFEDSVFFIDASTIPGEDISEWHWNFGDGTFSSIQNPSKQYSIDGEYTVELIVNTSNGCMDTLTREFDLYPKPKANFELFNHCLNEAAKFNSTAFVSSGEIDSTLWIINESVIEKDSFEFYFAKDSTYLITQVVVSDFNCRDTLSDSLIVYPLPVVNFDFNGVCFGDSTIFTSTAYSENSDQLGLFWDFGNGEFDSIQTSNVLYSVPGGYPVKLTVTDSLGCINDTTVVVEIDGDLPVANFNFSPSSVQLGLDVTLTENAQNASIFEWDLGDGIGFDEGNQIVYNYQDTGVFVVTLTASKSNGCLDVISLPLIVKTPPKIASVFTPNGDNINDVVPIQGGPYQDVIFTIYNRWGQQVFQSLDPGTGWDGNFKGEIQPNGVYVYTLEGTLLDGTKYRETGDITLVR